MDSLFFILFLLSPVLLVVGLLKPDLFKKIPIKDLNRKKLSGIFLSLMLLSFVGTGMTADTQSDDEPKQALGTDTEVSSLEVSDNSAVVKRVIDGDTIELESGSRVRYIGIDTPEFSPVECYAEQAKKKNRELVEGKEVRLEKDVSNTDKYNRLLRYIWINDTMINEVLVREGYAQSSTYPPDVKYQERFREAERLAREEGKGLWGDMCIAPAPSTRNTPTSTAKPKAINYTPTPTVYVAPYVPLTQPTETTTGGDSWTCNCSKTCPNMSSCEEAYFQLNNCGCSIRDGDNDGVPCENICPGG